MSPIVHIIVGPTGVGKTNLSLLIAQRWKVEIISADSRQIYRYMDIGTDKVWLGIRKLIPHYFIDICSPLEYYSAGMFGKQARKKIDAILKREKVPLVVGGSGFYIRALVDGLFELETRDETIRRQLEDRLQKNGPSALFNELQKLDPRYVKKISKNDRQRILRSLEVFYVTGKPLSYWHDKTPEPASFTPVFWGLTSRRAQLYRRINRRVENMFKNGLEDEVRTLLKMGVHKELNAMKTVGYKEVIDYFEGKINRAEMIDLVKRNSRRYAKRQLTWFKADQRIQWRNVETEDDLEKIAEEIIHYKKD